MLIFKFSENAHKDVDAENSATGALGHYASWTATTWTHNSQGLLCC